MFNVRSDWNNHQVSKVVREAIWYANDFFSEMRKPYQFMYSDESPDIVVREWQINLKVCGEAIIRLDTQGGYYGVVKIHSVMANAQFDTLVRVILHELLHSVGAKHSSVAEANDLMSKNLVPLPGYGQYWCQTSHDWAIKSQTLGEITNFIERLKTYQGNRGRIWRSPASDPKVKKSKKKGYY